MNTHADKTQENKSQSMANAVSQKQSSSESTVQFVDNRPEAIAQRKLQEMANNSPQVRQLMSFREMPNNCPQVKQAAQLQAMANYSSQQQQPIQRKENKTGLPDNLKSGIENLSGYSMDDVKVHYNSDKPAQLQAHAYAQGTDIHFGSGQEKHLPHEAWHVVQQKQGRVKPTMQMKGSVNINDDAGLEKEADVMGAKVLTDIKEFKQVTQRKDSKASSNLLQMARKGKRRGGLSGAAIGAAIGATIGSVFPGIGTFLGLGIGGGIGLLVGAVVGGKIGDVMTGTETEANIRELGQQTTNQITAEQAAWQNAASGNRKFVHGVTDYDNPHTVGADTATQARKDQMTEKLTNPEVLQSLLVSTTLIDSVEGAISDWTGSGLVLNIPKENIYAASSTDLGIDSDAIKRPGGLVPEVNRMRSKAESESNVRITQEAGTAEINKATPEEILEIESRRRGPLPTPDEIIADTGHGHHNEIAAVGTVPTGEVITGAGYYYLVSYDGNPITSGPLSTTIERIQLLKDQATIKDLPLYTIRAAVDSDGTPVNQIPGAGAGASVRIGPPFN